MLEKLETHTQHLEELVAVRTHELNAEKKKVELLLYNILPKWVRIPRTIFMADSLKDFCYFSLFWTWTLRCKSLFCEIIYLLLIFLFFVYRGNVIWYQNKTTNCLLCCRLNHCHLVMNSVCLDSLPLLLIWIWANKWLNNQTVALVGEML